ncbi:MAG: hypothetical protein FJ011_22125 [Chloroflexi bacterium]|nr:hypothetical protein [Chloroflexota bacterium]
MSEFPTSTSNMTLDDASTLCEHCDWGFLVPAGEALPVCPHCQRAVLTLTAQLAAGAAAPELAVPFSVTDVDLTANLQRFASGFLFAPPDLTAGNLRSRLQSLYLPRWLVDCDVQAEWRAEVGFNYQVVSHEDQYSDATRQWQSREVRETRVRWETRVGRLVRRYENVVAPAMEEDEAVRQRLGDFDLTPAAPVAGRLPESALIRTANRSTEDAWSDAAPAIRQRAAAECGAACRAHHIREFEWRPQFGNRQWTHLVLPVYASYYADADGVVYPVFIHGQTGKVYGRKQAAFRPARNLTLALGAAGLLILLASLLLVLLEGFLVETGGALSGLGALGVLVAMALGIAAVLPVAYVWIFNRRQPPDPLL